MSIFDTLSGALHNAIPGIKNNLQKQFQDELDRAMLSITASFGSFLQTGQQIANLKARAQAQQNSSNVQVRNQAIAIVAKANGLLTQFSNIQTNASAVLANLAAVKNQIQSSGVFNFDLSKSVGSRITELYNQLKGNLGNSTLQAVAVTNQIRQHMKDVSDLGANVQGLEDFAQGKGLSATLSNFGAGFGADVISPAVKIVTVGALIYFLGPSLLGKFTRRK